MFHRWLVALLPLAIVCPVSFANTFTVTVKAIDADKKPVAKADVGLFWTAKDGAMTPAGEKPIVTDADGKAVLRVDDWNEKRPLLVLSADRTLGGLVGVSKADDGKEATVALGPTIRLKGKLECKEAEFQAGMGEHDRHPRRVPALLRQKHQQVRRVRVRAAGREVQALELRHGRRGREADGQPHGGSA